MAVPRSKDTPPREGLSEDEDLVPPQPANDGGTPVASDDVGRITPMMEQYIEIKAANPDSLLFYRMGDFYELFFDDAEVASRALGIMLTKRGKHLGRDIPMCGVPVERSDEYLHRLIALGHRVAVCEQLEDPAEAKKRGAKSVVKRDVVRLVTPGTLTEDSLLDAKRNNYLLAIARARASDEADRFALAWIDISTGEFRIVECEAATLTAEVARLEPSEVILPDALYNDPDLDALAAHSRPRDAADARCVRRRHRGSPAGRLFQLSRPRRASARCRASNSPPPRLASPMWSARSSASARPCRRRCGKAAGATLAIDQATRANLELTRTLGGERRGSLLAAIDRTVTAAGSRLLAQRLSAPLTDPKAIERRLDSVSILGRRPDRATGDARAAQSRARSGARLVAACGRTRRPARSRRHPRRARCRKGHRRAALQQIANCPAEISDAAASLQQPDAAIAAELASALADELPAFKRDGGFVRHGFEAALDEVRALRDESRKVVAQLQARYADDTGVRAPENPAQQCARLFRRGDGAARRQADGAAAQCAIHPSPDAGRTGALHHHGTRRTGGQDRKRRRPRARPRA